MNKAIALVITCVFLMMGIIYFSINHGLIIIKFPSSLRSDDSAVITHEVKKDFIIYFWSKDSFKTEKVSLLWSSDKAQALKTLVSSWVTVLDDTECMPKKFSLATVMVSGTDAYISFTHTLFDNQESMHEKWMRVESLLKTIKASGLPIANVHLSVHHKPINDPHLDFSHAWPVTGFI